MFRDRREKISFAISLTLHLTILLLFLAFSFSPEYDETEYVTVGFGAFGKLSSSGAIGKKITREKKVEKKKEIKNVELPKTINTDDKNKIVAADKNKNVKAKREVKPLVSKEDKSSKGRELAGEGTGKFGFDIDFGGKGIRRIYSYNIPPYPSGVSKEIDVKIRFTILPDGTVGRTLPLIKADTRLETAAINSLRQWRFEPLPKGQKQSEQTAVIIFPFRLQ